MKKLTFYTRWRDGIHPVQGWTDGQFGYYAYNGPGIKCWYAVDLDSGQAVAAGKTRKEAAYEAQSSYVQTKMAEHKESPLYDIQVAEFAQLKMEKEAVVS